MSSYDGKVALITGAARGQGASHARALVREGARVFVTDVRDDEGRALAQELGDAATFLHHDVASEADWQAVVEALRTSASRLDLLVNNAGIYEPGNLEQTSLETVRRTVAVNQVGPLIGVKATVGLLRETGGASIINVSSVSGLRGFVDQVAYIPTKWALIGLSRALAAELAPDIRVNVICPGFIDTPMVEANTEEFNRVAIAETPLKRAGRPEEVTELILFLGSQRASFVTGSVIAVDGGIAA